MSHICCDMADICVITVPAQFQRRAGGLFQGVPEGTGNGLKSSVSKEFRRVILRDQRASVNNCSCYVYTVFSPVRGDGTL